MKLTYLTTLPFYLLFCAAIFPLPMHRFVLALLIFWVVDCVSYGSGFIGGLKRGN